VSDQARGEAGREQVRIAIMQTFPLGSEQGGTIREHLHALAQSGVLTSRADLIGYFQPRVDPLAPARPIAVFGVPTRDRVQSLARCLRSYLEYDRHYGRTTEYVVIDGSHGPDTRQANRQLLCSLADYYGAEVSYAGLEEIRRFARELVRYGGLPGTTVEFGLLNPEGCPVTTGGSRNALLLHAVGETLLQVDDDTTCQLTPAPDAREGLAFSSLYDPTEFWFPVESGPLLPDGPATGRDILALHERMLGRSLSDCLAQLPPGADFDLNQTTAAFFRRLDRQEGRILVTSAGVVGHSGMGSSLYLLSLAGASRDRLLCSEGVYRQALAHQRVLRVVPRPTVCDGAYCMGLNLGLDNRQLLPPFLPVQRNQDGVFAALLRGCRPDGYFGFLPWALCHEPPDQRSSNQDDLWQSAAGLRTGQIIQALIPSIPASPAGTDCKLSLRALGGTLEEWGALPPGDFEELLRLRICGLLSKQALHLAELLRQYQGLPVFWGRDARQLLARLQEALPCRQYVVPSDLRAVAEEGETGKFFQRLVRRFGQLLHCWPDLVEVARMLRIRGIRLAEKL
jgi:hypothetical protein